MSERFVTRIALGVLAFLAVGILLATPRESRRQAVALIVGWFVPGAGHAMLGRWKKGLFFFAVLAALWLAGMWIVGFRPVSFDDNPFYFFGQFGSGPTTLLSAVVSSQKAVPRESLHPSWFDPGLLYVCVAGLLNLVVMLNVVDLRSPGVATLPSSIPPVPPEVKA